MNMSDTKALETVFYIISSVYILVLPLSLFIVFGQVSDLIGLAILGVYLLAFPLSPFIIVALFVFAVFFAIREFSLRKLPTPERMYSDNRFWGDVIVAVLLVPVFAVSFFATSVSSSIF